MSAAIDLDPRPFSGLEELRALVPTWNALEEAPGRALCNAPEWALAHAEGFSSPGEPFGWTVADADGRTVGLLALRPEPSRGRLSLRRAILVQDGTFDSDYLEPSIVPGLEAPVMEALLDALARERRIEAVVLGCVPPEAPALVALRALLGERRVPVRETAVECAVADLPDGFDAYLAGLKSRMRTKVRSSLRAADKRGAVFHWCDSADDLPRHLEGLYRLHAMRWEEEGHGGSFADERRRRFYGALAPALLARGELRFSRFEVDGQPVAYQFGALRAGRYYQVQEGFDTALARERIGVALRAASVRRLIEEGVRRYDFMAGAARHKLDWGAAVVSCVTLAFPLPRLRARAAYAVRALVDRRRR